MSNNFDTLSIGNITIDTFLTIHEENKHVNLDKENNKLCINYGEKIDVEKLDYSLGGNACNTAVGLSRLGFKSGLMSEIGNDEFSQKIINILNKENVSLDLLTKTSTQSSLSVIINFLGERTLFAEYAKRNNDFNFENISAKLLYLTSLGEDWENAYLKTIDFAKTQKITLAFNPGTLQIEKRDSTILSVLSKIDLLFVNKQEAEEILYGKDKNNPDKNNDYVKKLLYELQDLGPRIIVITDGKNGSYALDKDMKVYSLESINSHVVEKTGAGDAFTSGFLGAFLSDKHIKDAMKWGTINASSVIGQVGAQKGLLNKAEIINQFETKSTLETKEI